MLLDNVQSWPIYLQLLELSLSPAHDLLLELLVVLLHPDQVLLLSIVMLPLLLVLNGTLLLLLKKVQLVILQTRPGDSCCTLDVE